MIDVTIETAFDRPADEVFTYLADYEHGPEWQRAMTSARWTSPPPVGVGSTFTQVARFAGRELRSDYEVTAYEPPREVAIRSTSGPFPITVLRTVEPTATGCRVIERTGGGPSGAARLLTPLMALMVRRTIARDYRALKSLLEAR